MKWIAIAALLLSPGAAHAGGIRAPDRLRCEYLPDPPVIDVPAPRFSWVPRHDARGQAQTAYRIVVATDPALQTGVVWDSGKVASSASAQIAYAGSPLRSGLTHYWQVRYWDGEGRVSPVSRAASFGTGMMRASDWKAQWIGGGNELRYEFALRAPVRRARVFVSALGYVELRINGRRVGNSVLDPAWTDFRKRALYTAYPVAGLLHQGANAIGVRLGTGRASEPAVLLQLQIETAAGDRMVVSSPDWRCRRGALRSDSVYDGEVYDAREESAGWDQAGFDDSGWSRASLSQSRPAALSAQMIPPAEVTATLPPRSSSTPAPGVVVFDFGQLMSGWAQVRVRGPRGTVVRLRYAEALLPDGNIDRASLRAAKAEDTYILRGEDVETYEPSFTYHGFRYVEISGYPGMPAPGDVRARVVGTALDSAGSFTSSSAFLNQLQSAIHWTLRSNLLGIPTDNNQRDERLGWLADAHLAAEVASLHFDLAAFYTKFLRDIADAQNPDGGLPNVVPVVDFAGVQDGDPAWESAYILLCWHMYREYGDRRILERHFGGLQRLMAKFERQAAGGLLVNGRFGDWIGLEETPPRLVANFYYIRDAEIVSQIAGVLGDRQLAAGYGALADRLKTAYRSAYRDVSTQCALALAIELGLTGRDAAGRALAENIGRHDGHLATGIVGTRFLLPALTSLGRSDLAYQVLNQQTYPGWGYMLRNGATALWELWRFVPERRMKSRNQVMLGSAGAWLYETLAGVHKDASVPAYRRIVIEPYFAEGLPQTAVALRTIAGDIAASWARAGDGLSAAISVPVNSTALVRLPSRPAGAAIFEGGRPIWSGGRFVPGVAGIRAVQETSTGIEIEIACGDYHFQLDGYPVNP
jgi:alpha-L-rhamnosidase